MPTLHTTLTWDGEPARADEIARVTLQATADGARLEVDAPYHGDPPPPGPPGPTDRLWEHEVVELFLAEADAPRYLEVELGPHGHHLVLRLEGIRRVRDLRLPLEYTARVQGGRWTGVATIPAAYLPSGPPAGWRVNACAIHGPPTARRYLTAARLGATQPDFHRPDEFIVHGG